MKHIPIAAGLQSHSTEFFLPLKQIQQFRVSCAAANDSLQPPGSTLSVWRDTDVIISIHLSSREIRRELPHHELGLLESSLEYMASFNLPDRSIHRLIIGIDYGTTFSGVSYVMTGKSAHDINIISTWPGAQFSESKTPTRIAYACENQTSRSRNPENSWGFLVEPKHISYSWTKLLLDQSATIGKHDDPSLSKSAGSGVLKLPSFRDAAGVCEDFLREVCTFVYAKLCQEMTERVFEMTPTECWITLPAIWSDQAKNLTLTAAKNAGFGSRAGDKIFTITEPEAAAMAALHDYADPNSMNPVKPKENVLICDCGGGTVDITTYTIIHVSPHLVFDELQIGTGGKCGSTYIDRNFHLLLSKWFGSDFDSIPFSKKGPGSTLMREFERRKLYFGLGNNRDTMEIEIGAIKLNIPDSEHFDEDERKIILTYEDMQSLFDPVIADITSLLDEQIKAAEEKDAKIDRVILVGGFTESQYLCSELENWCWQNGDMELIRPAHPQAAVLRGAALRGLEGLAPRKKYARKHYGVGIGLPFRENIDPEQLAFRHFATNEKRCGGRMQWLISKGDEITEGTLRTSEFCQQYFPEQEVTFDDDLYSCSTTDAPEYVTDSDVELVGVIKTTCPKNFAFGGAVESFINPKSGKRVKQLSFQTQVIFGNTGSNLTFKNIVNNTEVGTAEIVFDQS